MIQSLSLLKYIIKEDEEEMKPRHVPSSNSTEYLNDTDFKLAIKCVGIGAQRPPSPT